MWNRSRLRIFLTLLLFPWLAACSVTEVEIRMKEDLSGRFTTVLASETGNENCAGAPKALQDMVSDLVSKDPGLAGVLRMSPYNTGSLAGVRTSFEFESPDEIQIRIGQMQRLDLDDEEPPTDGEESPELTESRRELREHLSKITSLPVDFDLLISPPVIREGVRTWRAEFRGDPGKLADLNFGDDPANFCSPAEMRFRVVMPAPISEFSSEEGGATATRLDDHTVEWVVPRKGGEVTLTVVAVEPMPDAATDDSTSEDRFWLSTEFWLAALALLTALFGALTAWAKYRSGG